MSAKMQFLVCGALLCVAACSSSGEPPSAAIQHSQSQSSDSLNAARIGDHLVIRNTTGRPIVFATLDRQFFESVAASYCFGSASCGTDLAAADSTSIKTSSINGVTPTSHDVIVFWWYTADVPPHQGGAPAKVRQLVVPVG